MFFADVLIVLVAFHGVNCEEQKRLVFHSSDDIALEFQTLRQEIEALKINHTNDRQMLQSSHAQEIQSLKSTQAQELAALKTEISVLKSDQGSTYVRWGKTACDGNGTEKVYSGFTSGSPYDVEGAASYVCLPQHPTWAKYKDGIQGIGGKISGTEYEMYSTIDPFSQNMQDQDAPCVVCRSPRPTTVMIPGRKDCYPNWTQEYTGYLMSGHSGHKGGSDYACVDADPEAVYHGEADQNGKLLYLTEVKCGSLPCQEYPDGRELACVVCSK
ncbi:uncharacterized protein LOC128550308 [Mercenaria mercenaria]|uniref:uncharacterized protein LOC128550308 n=1 Tax=Mercenaria mercenaria TaxID=6596 RepID=UPI00234F8587|nr:uncharacterized protein LOC128550308 [Mercenaria mercenaria]